MSDMRQCDACGALEAAGEFPVGSGHLSVVKAQQAGDWQAFVPRSVPTDTYHFCVACTRQLLAMLNAHRLLREAGRA